MKILIIGIDGYLGWPLAIYLINKGHHVKGIDNFLRRVLVKEQGSYSAIPIYSVEERKNAVHEHFKFPLSFDELDILDNYKDLERRIKSFKPDTIVHLGEIPSAPYSMKSLDNCVFTHENNVIGTLNLLYAIKEAQPDAHLVKLGTMGEYGTPNVDIPEGFYEVNYRGRKDVLSFPRQAGSWYHWTKVHDSNNIAFACKIWGLRSTDIMQGVVFGTKIKEIECDKKLATRFDFDQVWGTALNRFCAEAIIGHSLTIYGSGLQKRGFIPLRDSIECISRIIEAPPEEGEYRVINQFEKVYNLYELAEMVQSAAKDLLGIDIKIEEIKNPRIEAEDHYYNPDRNKLVELGYKPKFDIYSSIISVLSDLVEYSERILEKKEVLMPDIFWKGSKDKIK